MSAAGNHTCVPRPDGAAVRWGRPLDCSQSGSSSGERFGAVGAGSGYTCGLREDGEVVWWTTYEGG